MIVEREQAAQRFFAGGGAYRVADAVVFGQRFDFVEIVAKIEIAPPVSVADHPVKFAVQAAQFQHDAVNWIVPAVQQTGFDFRSALPKTVNDHLKTYFSGHRRFYGTLFACEPTVSSL